jgi:hypothetical protein
MYNHTSSRAWKYEQLTNKMPYQKSMSCIIVANGTPIQCNIHIINMNVVNHVWFFDKLHYNFCDNYITIDVNVAPNQQLHCNKCMASTHMIMPHVHISTTN